MKEIEVLVMINSTNFKHIKEQILQKASFVSKNIVIDTYFFDPLRKNLQPDDNFSIYECFRLRKKDCRYYLTYKVDKFDNNGKWLYSDENESELSNGEEVKKIIHNLGLKELVIVDMLKEYYENDNFNIAIEYVKDLGAFLEVESKKKVNTLNEIKKEKCEIQKFISSLDLNVTSDVGIGKPEMLLKKYKDWKK